MKEEIIVENLRKAFESFFLIEKSESLRDIFREMYGNDYPEEANPDSYITITDLQNIVQNLNVGPGKTFIDLGCGRGGPGLWVAKETEANYVGIDLAESAIKEAKQRGIDHNLRGTFKFQVGDISFLDFPEQSFDGAISIDVFQYMPNL